MRTPLGLAAGLLLAPLSLAACKQLSSGAREDFATRYSCPEERVEVRPREDLDPAQVLARKGEVVAAPSEEVKKDPARLAKWQKDQATRRENEVGRYAGYSVLEATGCGHTEILVCHHPSGSRGGTRTDAVSCERNRTP